MKTEFLEINPNNIDSAKIKKAARIIREGGLVAFPTETVYGLGGDALNPTAVVKIFEAKNRPLEDPLIVHISQREDLFKLAKDVPDMAMELTDKFWPGPLTLVLRRSEMVPDIVSAGLDTVALRMPDNELALTLIKESQTSIAAPSANLFGRPSPTCAGHVLDDLDGRIDVVIDGGMTFIGVESTVLDLTQEIPCILRPGGVSKEKLKKIIPTVEVYKQNKILSPGMYPRHYAPDAEVVLVEGSDNVQVEKIRVLASEFQLQGYSIGIIAKAENKGKYGGFNVKSLGPGNDFAVCAANLFSVLREFDKGEVDIIIVESLKEEGLGLAIMDRLRKAGTSQAEARGGDFSIS